MLPDLSKYDHYPSGVLVLAPSGAVLHANEALGLLLGMDPKQLAGRQSAYLSPAVSEQAREVFQTGTPGLNSRIRIRDRLLAAHLFPIFSDGEVGFVVAYLNEAGEDGAEALFPESFKEVAKQLEAMMESSFDGLWISNHMGMVVRVNRAALRLAGLPREEVEGRYVGDLLKDGNFKDSVTLEVLRRKTTVTMVQHLKTGKKVLATGSPIFGSDGEIAFVVINDRDITLLERMRKQIEERDAQLEHYRSELSIKQLQELDNKYFVCRSEPMRLIYQEAMRVAKAKSTVLITGESGVGKGMLAKLIHMESQRAKGPFVRVDCAAIASSLFESEMFGYATGAFTGAGRGGKPGLVELAQGGTLFLDEVSEIAPANQVKLLRFLDERRLMPVGASREKEVDTRVIAATNKDLAAEVEAKRFRNDLFYRFNVVPLKIPPLRERPKDIIDLMRFFLRKVGEENDIYKDTSPEARNILLNYSYPGNVRELQNIIERILILSPGDCIEAEDLPREVRSVEDGDLAWELSQGKNLREHLRQVETKILRDAVKRLGSQRKAARRLGVSQSTIARKLQNAP